MSTTGWFDARWQRVSGTQFVAPSTERDAQQLCHFVVAVIGPITARVAFGLARHSVALIRVMVGTMEPETSRDDYTKNSRLPLAFNDIQSAFTGLNPCHNFTIAPTKFWVIRRVQQTRYVIIISCVTV